jgi:dihydroflavonol-4-reductase
LFYCSIVLLFYCSIVLLFYCSIVLLLINPAKIISLPTMILVTGGTGLVGSQLLFDLTSSGEKVRALRRAESNMNVVNRLFAASPQLLQNIEWFEGNVNDFFSIEEAMDGVDTVYHSAAFISFYPSDNNKMMKVNVEGTANMVNMAMKNGIKRFCHVSSVAAIGRNAGDEFVDENSWWKTSKQNSNYAISKYGGEREVWRAIEEGLSAFIVNPTIIIGPGNWTSGSTQMFSQVWKGLSFYTDGSTGFVDSRDVSKSAIMLMKKGIENERYIINSENVTYRYVFDLIAENFGRKKATIRVTPFMAELGWRFERAKSLFTSGKPMITKETARNSLMKWNYSNEKIKKEIGIDFISVEESIKFACEAFLKVI